MRFELTATLICDGCGRHSPTTSLSDGCQGPRITVESTCLGIGVSDAVTSVRGLPAGWGYDTTLGVSGPAYCEACAAERVAGAVTVRTELAAIRALAQDAERGVPSE